MAFKFKYALPFYPLIQLIRIQAAYGFIPLHKWKIITIWLFKLIVLEPLRLFEALLMACLPDKNVRAIFILGYYRSGTTYLQELTACNDHHRTLTIFQAVLPEVSLCFAWLFKPAMSAVVSLLKVQNQFHYHPFNWDYPSEEDIAITAMSCYHDYNRITQYPSRFESLTDRYLNFTDKQAETEWIDSYRYLIKKLSYIYPGKTLVLKSPPNMGRVQILQSCFKGSRFIFIHRDPVDAIKSARRLWKLNRPFVYESFDDASADRILTYQYMTFYDLFRSQGPSTFCPEVRFQELILQPVQVMKTIYDKFDLQDWANALVKINETVAKRKIQNPPVMTHRNNAPELNEHLLRIRSELGYDV